MIEYTLKLTIIFFIWSNTLYAQNIDLLHVQSEGYYLLPSEIGAHNKKWEVNSFLNSKTLLKDLPLRTYALTGDYQVKRGLKRVYIGGSIGSTKLLNTPYAENEFHASFAYHQVIQNQSISIGIQPGILIRNLDTDWLIFPDQYDRTTGGFNSNSPTNELIELNNNSWVFNMNVGIAYGFKLQNSNLRVLLAGRNLNNPSMSFSNTDYKIDREYLEQIKMDYYLSTNQILKSYLLLKQGGKRSVYNLGSEIYHQIKKSSFIVSQISAGSSIIIQSANYPNVVVFNLGIGFYKSKLGFAYAYNFAGNKLANSFNTFEIMLSFFAWHSQLDFYSVPCEIY